MRKIIEVKVLDHYQLELTFDDGLTRIVDLTHLVGKGVFESWRNYDFFKQVEIGSSGELVWGDQIDLCPDSLYLQVTGTKYIHPDLLKKYLNNQSIRPRFT